MKFYLPILLLLLVSITSLQKKRARLNSFLQSNKLFPHKDNSIVMQLPEQKETPVSFTFKRVTEKGIILTIPKNEKLKEEYAPYFQSDEPHRELLIPFPYIRLVLKENHGHKAANLHCMISPNLSTKRAKISIYLPKRWRGYTINEVLDGMNQFRMIAYSIQLHSRLQMLSNQFKNNCNAIKNEVNLKTHLLILIQRSIHLREDLKKIKDYREALKEKSYKRAPKVRDIYDYNSFKRTFFIEDISESCPQNNTVIIKENDIEYNLGEIGKEGLREAIQLYDDFFYYEEKGKFVGMNSEEIYEAMKDIFYKDKSKEHSINIQFDENGKEKQ